MSIYIEETLWQKQLASTLTRQVKDFDHGFTSLLMRG